MAGVTLSKDFCVRSQGAYRLRAEFIQDSAPKDAQDQDFLGPGSLNLADIDHHDDNNSNIGNDVDNAKIYPKCTLRKYVRSHDNN